MSPPPTPPTVTFDGATLRRTDTGEEIAMPAKARATTSATDPQGLTWSWVAVKIARRDPMDAVEQAWKAQLAAALLES